MTGFDRRTAIRLAVASAIAGSAATRPAFAGHLSGGLIAPPSGQMIYRRSVERDMARGAQIRVTRDFVVEFRPAAEGFLLQGYQSSVEVEAPAALARFAELEQQRDESAIFPLGLDAFGHITSPAPRPDSESQIAAAVEEAISTLSQQQVDLEEREQAQLFVAAFHNSGQRVTAILPTDLFAPAGGERRTQQSIALPGGGEGIVETLFGGELDDRTGLMSAAQREIVTSVDASTRLTRESWSLALV